MRIAFTVWRDALGHRMFALCHLGPGFFPAYPCETASGAVLYGNAWQRRN